MSDVLGQTVSEEATLNSRGYHLLKKLGEGSYAKVYLSEYRPIGTPQASQGQNVQLACKIIDTAKAPRDFVRKFLPRELDILVKLNHPHIVHVHSIFQKRSKYFIFMRYAENGDLLDYILKNGAASENQARVWARQMILALQYMHELEIAHRDIKLENILITSNYNIKMADFGFARYMVDSKGRRVLSETYCGSVSYAAPEVLRGMPYNPKIADLWSLGVVFFIVVNKAMPFDDKNMKRLYECQMSKKWKLRAKAESTLSEQLKKILRNTLEPDVAKRWNATQLVQSDWIAMEPKLTALTPAEKQALAAAHEERKKIEGSDGKSSNYAFKRMDSPTRTGRGRDKDDTMYLKTPGTAPNPSFMGTFHK